jgi:ESF2/ABP1 family protein
MSMKRKDPTVHDRLHKKRKLDAVNSEEDEEDVRKEEEEEVGENEEEGEEEASEEEEEEEDDDVESEEKQESEENDEGEGKDESEEIPKDKKERKRSQKKVLSTEAIEKWNKKQEKRGIIYISSIPPFMTLVKLRQVLSQYGKIDRIYLTPDTRQAQKQKKKVDSRTRAKYMDGWVEFLDKTVAKQVAESLNMTQVGGSRKSRNFYDVWNMKYLKGFKWSHLTEKIAYDKALKEQKLRAELRQMKRANNMYLSAVENAKVQSHIEERKKKKKGETEVVEETVDSSEKLESLMKRFPQHAVIAKPKTTLPSSFLMNAFGSTEQKD